MSERRFVPVVTVALAVLNLVGFGIELAAGGDIVRGPAPLVMIDLGGNFGPLTLDGEPWRLLSSMFLHYGIIHLAANMYGLYVLGMGVERMYGRASYLALYLVSGLVGSLTSAVLGTAVSAGASGAVFGVIGAFGAYLAIHRNRIDRTALKRQVASLAALLGINLYIGLSVQSIDMGAHVGGLIAGFVLGLALEAGHRYTPGLARRRLQRALVVGVLGAGLVVGATFIVPKPSNSIVALASLQEAETVSQGLQGRPIVDVLDEIERTALPAWNRAVGDIERDKTMPADIHDLTLRYARARRDHLDLTVRGSRGNDAAMLERAAEQAALADVTVAELNQKLASGQPAAAPPR